MTFANPSLEPRALRLSTLGRNLLFLYCLTLSTPVNAEPFRPDSTKAAYLYNIFKLAKFPEHAHDLKPSPRTLCMLVSETRKIAFRSIEHKQIDGQPLLTRYLNVEELSKSNCDVLFISDAVFRENENVLELLEARPVLTIGESINFCQRGGILNFYEEDGIVLLELNQKRATEQRFEIDPKLRRLARSFSRTNSETSGDE